MEVYHNKFRFVKCYDANVIQQKVKQIAAQINEYYAKLMKQQDNPKLILVCTLKGAFMFYADLIRYINVPNQSQFIKPSSYEGFQSTGKIKFDLVLHPDQIKDKHILIIEDIIDTGKTLKQVVKIIKQSSPKTIELCTLFQRPNKQYEVNVKFRGFFDGRFIIGYGIDYDQFGRSFPEIYVKDNEANKKANDLQ